MTNPTPKLDIDTTWGPFAVKMWAVRGQYKVSVHQGEALLFWAVGDSRRLMLTTLDCVLRALADARGLRLNWWRDGEEGLEAAGTSSSIGNDSPPNTLSTA